MKVSEAPRDGALVEPGQPSSAAGRVTKYARRVTARLGAVTWTQRAALAIVLFGGALRLYHFDSLSLWVDEGLTVAYARYPWPTVLGLHGAYDVHPPLYYAVVKLVTMLVPEVVAGRLVSVIAGTLTIAVLYALVSRLADPRVALGAALVLAVSPLHIW